LLEPIQEVGFEDFYYAYILTLDLTTHGQGVEGALVAAQELVEAWVSEKRSRGETIPSEAATLISQKVM
jgi:predicted RNase H-like HicB family nuclease